MSADDSQDTEVPAEVVESLDAVLDTLVQEMDMGNLENCCHFADEGFTEPATCWADREPGGGWMERALADVKLVLQSVMSQADDLQDHLVNTHSRDRETVVNTVQHFLKSCQPLFNKLEAVARDTGFRPNPLPYDVSSQFVDASQQLCDRLKQLLLTCASCKLLSLADSDPLGVSHFAVGQSDARGLRLSAFVYCRPAPYLAQVNTGLYKCMRWNVDVPGGPPAANDAWDGKSEDIDADKLGLTEYYFLCYEDSPHPAEEADKRCQDAAGEWVRKWSIGLWMPFEPGATADDIVNWLLCPVPSAGFRKLLLLDKEPSSWHATDLLLQLLQPLDGSEP